MSSNSRLDTLLLLIFTSSSSLLLLLAHVFNKIPTDPYGNFNGCHLWLSPLFLCNWSDNQVFLNFHSKSLVPTLAIGDNQKWREPWEWGCVHHRLTCFTCMLNLPDVHGFPPFRQRTWKECLFLNLFFITLTLFCWTVKLTKLKYTC